MRLSALCILQQKRLSSLFAKSFISVGSTFKAEDNPGDCRSYGVPHQWLHMRKVKQMRLMSAKKHIGILEYIVIYLVNLLMNLTIFMVVSSSRFK